MVSALKDDITILSDKGSPVICRGILIILDDSNQRALRTCESNRLKKMLLLCQCKKCPEQIKLSILLLTCASYSEPPSDKSTKFWGGIILIKIIIKFVIIINMLYKKNSKNLYNFQLSIDFSVPYSFIIDKMQSVYSNFLVSIKFMINYKCHRKKLNNLYNL